MHIFINVLHMFLIFLSAAFLTRAPGSGSYTYTYSSSFSMDDKSNVFRGFFNQFTF